MSDINEIVLGSSIVASQSILSITSSREATEEAESGSATARDFDAGGGDSDLVDDDEFLEEGQYATLCRDLDSHPSVS
jgi:hypothetical protein